MSAVRHRVLALLVGLSFVNYLLRNNLSIAMPAIRADFEFSNAQLGWILWSFSVPYTIFQIPGGLFSDRFGPRRALTILAVAWAAITALTGFVPAATLASAGGAFAGLMAARALTGATHAPIYPASAGAIARWYPPGHWALPYALLGLGLNLGQAATGPVVSALIAHSGWRGSFLALAPLGLLAGAAWWSFARDTPEQHRRVDAAERELISQGRAARSAASPALATAWRVALRNPQVLLLTGSYFCMNVVFLMFSQWLFTYLVEERGFSLLESGAYYAVPFIVGAGFATLGGWCCDHACRRFGPTWGCRLPAASGLLLVALFLLVGARAPNPVLAVGLLSLCYGFTQFTDSVYWSATTYAEGEHAAVAGGVLNTGGNVAGFLAPLIGYAIDRAGWDAAFALGSAFAVLGALLWFGVRLESPGARAALPSAVSLAP
jgi:ACS family glucarate transporter-like MFS transporter